MRQRKKNLMDFLKYANVSSAISLKWPKTATLGAQKEAYDMLYKH